MTTFTGIAAPEKVPPRDQVKALSNSELNSDRSALFFPGNEPGARQEDAYECDVNVIMARHGGAEAVLRTGLFAAPSGAMGVDDESIDLLEALRLAGEAREAFQALPVELRRRYGSWPAVVSAIDRGEIRSEAVVVPPEADKPPEGGPPKVA